MLYAVFAGCKNWHTLHFESVSQPIQFGNHHTTGGIDTLRTISGLYDYRFSEGYHSESENTRIIRGPSEDIENDFTEIFRALDEHPDHFIADGTVTVEVETSIPIFTFIGSYIASFITGEKSTMGPTNNETIYYDGVLYKINKKGIDSAEQ